MSTYCSATPPQFCARSRGVCGTVSPLRGSCRNVRHGSWSCCTIQRYRPCATYFPKQHCCYTARSAEMSSVPKLFVSLLPCTMFSCPCFIAICCIFLTKWNRLRCSPFSCFLQRVSSFFLLVLSCSFRIPSF